VGMNAVIRSGFARAWHIAEQASTTAPLLMATSCSAAVGGSSAAAGVLGGVAAVRWARQLASKARLVGWCEADATALALLTNDVYPDLAAIHFAHAMYIVRTDRDQSALFIRSAIGALYGHLSVHSLMPRTAVADRLAQIKKGREVCADATTVLMRRTTDVAAVQQFHQLDLLLGAYETFFAAHTETERARPAPMPAEILGADRWNTLCEWLRVRGGVLMHNGARYSALLSADVCGWLTAWGADAVSVLSVTNAAA